MREPIRQVITNSLFRLKSQPVHLLCGVNAWNGCCCGGIGGIPRGVYGGRIPPMPDAEPGGDQPYVGGGLWPTCGLSLKRCVYIGGSGASRWPKCVAAGADGAAGWRG